MEIILELTQEEANKVAAALGFARRNSHNHSKSYEQLLSDVANKLRNATREVDDDYERLIFEEVK